MLEPTPTRIMLMKAIADDQVIEHWFNDSPGEITHRYLSRDWKVTGKVRVMKTAGLCETSTEDADLHLRRIALTAEGSRWLARAEQEALR